MLSTISTGPPDTRSAKVTLKVTRETCDGSPVLCSRENYGFSGEIGPVAQGERLVIAFTKIEAGDDAVNHFLIIGGPRAVHHLDSGLAVCGLE